MVLALGIQTGGLDGHPSSEPFCNIIFLPGTPDRASRPRRSKSQALMLRRAIERARPQFGPAATGSKLPGHKCAQKRLRRSFTNVILSLAESCLDLFLHPMHPPEIRQQVRQMKRIHLFNDSNSDPALRASTCQRKESQIEVAPVPGGKSGSGGDRWNVPARRAALSP